MSASWQLYSYFRSSASFRVRIALNLKSISYQYVPVHLVRGGGEQNSAQYAQLNPMRRVPMLVHNGFALSESMAILRYLDRVVPHGLLFPQDPKLEARVIECSEIINSGVQPLTNISVCQKLEHETQSRITRASWSAHWIREGLRAIDTKLKMPEYDFLNSADPLNAFHCCLIPQLYSGARFGVDTSEFPLIEKLAKKLAENDAILRAHPSQQPDFEE